MERGGERLPARVVRLRHTVRVQLKADASAEEKKRFGWDWVVVRLLRDFGGITPGKILCLQDFTAAGFLDVTFASFSDCSGFFDGCSRRPEEAVLRGLRLVPLFAMDEVPITVHLYNPFVADEDIRAFLGRYCSSVSAGEKVRGRFGIWNGKRRFQARLKVDPSAPGGLLHPPGSFAIGPHRGFLHYPGQPLYCRRCGGLGHTKEACTGRRCRLCGAEGHAAAECGAPKTCSLCGSEEHLFRQCPSRKGTFASLFADDFKSSGAPETDRQERLLPDTGRPDPPVTPGIQEAVGAGDGAAQEGGGPAAIIPEVAQEEAPTPSGDWATPVPNAAQSTWTPASWAEALEGLELVPDLAQPDWARMEIADGQDDGAAREQELPMAADFVRGRLTRAADATAEERDPKRSRREGEQEFALLPVETLQGVGQAAGEGAKEGGTTAAGAEPEEEEGAAPEGGVMEEEGWTQVRSRRTRPAAGRGKETTGGQDCGEN